MTEKQTLQLLVATYNPGKIKELRELLADLPVELRGLDEFSGIEEVEETGETFAENSILKARGYARQTGLLALADDSGLEVEALGGAPGVYSARYGGKDAADDERIEKLLGEPALTKSENRAACFVCAMTIAGANGEIRFEAEGICPGRLSDKPMGSNGFGYDPIFIPDGFEQTFGELTAEIKHNLSHRGAALAKIIQYLRDFIVV